MKAAGPAVQTLAAAAMSANEVSDQASTKNFLQVLKAALEAKKNGIEPDVFIDLMNSIRQNRNVVTSFEIEIAGALASSIETAEGKAFNVTFSAGGGIGGFNIGGSAGYTKNKNTATAEKSNQNFRILASGATYPVSQEQDKEFVAAVAKFVYRLPDGVQVPALPDDSGSGELLEKLMPLAAKLVDSLNKPTP